MPSIWRTDLHLCFTVKPRFAVYAFDASFQHNAAEVWIGCLAAATSVHVEPVWDRAARLSLASMARNAKLMASACAQGGDIGIASTAFCRETGKIV